jgi:hypothetical protein
MAAVMVLALIPVVSSKSDILTQPLGAFFFIRICLLPAMIIFSC